MNWKALPVTKAYSIDTIFNRIAISCVRIPLCFLMRQIYIDISQIAKRGIFAKVKQLLSERKCRLGRKLKTDEEIKITH